jgi:pimeloyl-ACP methyl ester carboxylesterase
VLIHGGGDGGYAWDFFAPVLAQRLTTIVVDLRGHGDSDWDRTGRYEANGYLADLVHVIDHSELGEFVLIGHSLGGQLAIRLGAHYAQRIRASVLVDFGPELIAEGREHAGWLLNESLRHYPTIESYAEWLKDTRHLSSPSALEQVARRALRATSDGFRLKVDPALVAAFPKLERRDSELLWRLLKEISCPTLIVRGGGSAVLSRAVAQRMVEVLPRGQLATINAAGHSVMLDNPTEFERTVLAFLENVLR